MSVNFYGTYERGLVTIDITMTCDLSFQCVFFPTKTTTNPFWEIMLENTASGAEFPRIFCAGIGPLQLGVMFVIYAFWIHPSKMSQKLLFSIHFVCIRWHLLKTKQPGIDTKIHFHIDDYSSVLLLFQHKISAITRVYVTVISPII